MLLESEIKNHISVEQAWYYKIVPKELNKGVLHLLIDKEKFSESILSELEIILGRSLKLETIATTEIERLLQEIYPKAISQTSNLEKSNFKLNVDSDKFLFTLVQEAKSLKSSDIHIEMYGEKGRVRFRVNGALIDRHSLNKAEYPIIINKIKVETNSCKIEEKRLPQDGRIRFQYNNERQDIRVSILPTLYGEKIVLRLLGSDVSHLEIEKLGFNNQELERYNIAVQKPNGIILISGPTGSGKTTTLYATLKRLNRPDSNILTIEDPIEYTLDGINQVQMREDIGLTYTEALRTFLRQDPDIIMLGEIRDEQTAQMAIRASLTGHLVLSTIHTNSAWGTISRLIDMNIPPYLIASTLNLSVAQRLIRTLCGACKIKQDLDKRLLPEKYRTLEIAGHYTAKGCNQCHYTGYKSRKAIYEVINITKEIVEYIKSNSTDIDEYCKINKIKKLADNALELFIKGDTSLEEIYPYLINEN